LISGLHGGQKVGVAVEPAFEPVGEEHAAQSRIDRYVEGGKRFAHSKLLECLPTAQQFAIDLAEGLPDLAGAVVVGEKRGRLSIRLLREVIHLRPPAGIAHREIVLGAMSRTVGTLASGLATSFVALDEGTAEDLLERGPWAQESSAAFSQSGRGFVRHGFQTTYITGLTLNYEVSFVHPFFWSFSQG